MTSVYIIILNIVKEKEDNLRDGLLINSVNPIVFWISWFLLFIVEGFITLTKFIILIIIIIIIIIIIMNKLYITLSYFCYI